MIVHLLEVALPIWAVILIPLLGTGGIIVGLLTWIRFRSKDVADVRSLDATTEKTLQEARETKTRADRDAVDTALKVMERLEKEVNKIRTELNEKDMTLDKTEEKLNKLSKSLNDAMEDVGELKTQLAREKSKTLTYEKELDELKSELLVIRKKLSVYEKT